MNPPVELHQAYVLHTRSYRETSLIVDFLVPDVGRISAVVRGARRPKSPQRSLLQPFARLLISWYGKGELKTLKLLESDNQFMSLQGRALFSGLYLNELLIRLIKAEEPCETLFKDYQQALLELTQTKSVEPVLRCFEKQLLQTLGYWLSFPEKGSEQASCFYFDTDSQWLPMTTVPTQAQQPRCFLAADLAAIAQDDYSADETLRAAKRLMRLALAPLLGDKPLRSKDLFIKTY